MNAHALTVLEFTRALGVVAARAPSALGSAHVLALRPTTDRTWLEREQSRVTAMRALISFDVAWAPMVVPDAGAALARLRLEGTTWTGAELLQGATLLASSRRTRDALTDARRPPAARAVLAPFTERLMSSAREEDAIGKIVGDDGDVRDDASPLLRRIRRELRGAEADLVRLLERVVSGLEAHQRVLDASVTIRNGRYVIPVRRDARGVVGGIVHDTSGSGQTLFVEPPAAIEFGNRIRELESDESGEVERLLGEATERLRPLQPEMLRSLDALVELESLYARASFARDFACHDASFADAGAGVRLVEARHPLLVAQGADVVPFDLELQPEQRTLLLSGPNTGGKTVLLKAVGLTAALLQSGVPVTVGERSVMPLFDDVFADVGDEQSIAASLSTFSAHVHNIGEILERATPRSLVLIDELGSGTDPQEGASLGGAVLEALTQRGTLTVATTHLGALKELATEVPGVVNGSLQFDAERLAPTYRLTVGIPGRSFGLSIARRLGLPASVLARAEERLPRAERDYEALLADLEQRSADLAVRERDVTELRETAAERVASLAEREGRVRARERSAEKDARDQTRRYLLEARAEVDAAIRRVREAQLAAQEKTSGAATGAAVEEAARAARRAVERLASEHGERLEALEEEDRVDVGGLVGGEVRLGDVVSVATLGGRLGTVAALREDGVVVVVGGLKLSVPVSAVTRSTATGRPRPAEITVPTWGDFPETEAKSEIDVRGMRAHEVEELVLQAVDAAVRSDLKLLRIIHGKGTGALRERVGEMLQKDSRVTGFRLGAWNEGGSGVTVAELS